MYAELSRGEWPGGATTLRIVDPNQVESQPQKYGKPATDYSQADIGYEFDSDNDPSVDVQNPTPVMFYPEELHDMIAETRKTLEEDPFNPADFEVLRDHGEGLLGQVGDDAEGQWCKQFKMKYNDEGVLYLKVQRGAGNTWLRGSPTLGQDEFEKLFSGIAVL